MISFPRITSLACLGIALAFACSPASPTGPDRGNPMVGDGDGDSGVGGDGDDPTGGDGDLIGGDGDLLGGDGDLLGGDGDLPIYERSPTPNCADGVRDDDEACDDGNQMSDDGCGFNCRYIETGYVCPAEGEPCRQYAKCGDGIAVFPEACDDGNLVPGDGCNENCKIEIGFKCEGAPSVCGPAVCGNGGEPEGAETCDDGNGLPFDGCSEICQGEPKCTSEGCTSTCGDGLLLSVAGEECDDGNSISGDGCSADCKFEPGYECTVAPRCPDGGDDCPLELPIVFRDFNVSHSDFQAADPPGTENRPCDGSAEGMVAPTLDDDGKPVFQNAPAHACVTAFNTWYVDSDDSATILGDVTLYKNEAGAFVNRFGDDGEPYVASVVTEDEINAGQSLAACEERCDNMAENGQDLFDGLDPVRCDQDTCNNATQAVAQAENDLAQAEAALANAEAQQDPDPDEIADLEEAVEDAEAAVTAAEEAAVTCVEDCEEEYDRRMMECTSQCAPCASNPGSYCVGGSQVELDGDPLFFPIDDHPDALMDARSPARIPAQIYQGLYWPWEDPACGTEGTCNSPLVHNFHFTSEIAYWFEYTEGMEADLKFVGDDDVFVFINRRLVLDLGGIHVPLGGQFTLDADGTVTTRTWRPGDPDPGGTPADRMELELSSDTTSAADLGLVPGNVYEIKVFHAERKPEGSSFQLTLSGFTVTRSECTSICGDGILAAGEQCDNGAENNVGGHNGCNEDCTLGSYCGDGIVQEDEGENCDDADPDAPDNCNGCKVIEIR